MPTQKIECLLCAEQVQFIGVGECNHQPMCYRCIFKMRVISKNNTCPICKTECKKIIIMPQFKPFDQKDLSLIPDKQYGDIFYTNQEAKKCFQKLTQFKCFAKTGGKPCKHDKKFPSIAFLKKHLKQDHHRHICDICFDKKTCVLQEQKLYTFNNLNKHLERGDIDQFGNIVFLHPYCAFCKKHFFDDDQFKVHIHLQHMLCNVCGAQERLRFYKNYDSLENHYKMSHYICMQKDCLDKKFIAFASADQLKVHRMQIHQKQNRKIDLSQLCGFQYQGHDPNEQKIIIKDKQGVNMENQFLSLKKSKNRTLMDADMQQDRLFDIRDFYHCNLDQDQHLQKAFSLKKAFKDKTENKQAKQSKQQKVEKVQQKQQQEIKEDKNKNKKKYVSKKDYDKQKPQILKEDDFFLEDLLLIQSIHFSKLTNDQFDAKMRTIAKQQDVKKLVQARNKLFRKKIKQDQFVTQFFKIMKNVSLKAAYNIFPHFIRTILHEDAKYRLDDEFLKKLKKIPSKNDSLLKNSERYSDFFSKLLIEIQDNIEYRIEHNTLSIKKSVTKNKQRLYQIMGVVRRLKIQEMAKLKFATNFGLKQDTIQYLVNKVFRKSMKQIQNKLDNIQNEQFLDLYVFIKYCLHAVKHADNMFLEKHKIHQNILEDFLYERPHLQEKYGLKKSQLKTMQEQVQFQKLEDEKKYKKQLKQMEKKNKSYGYSTKTDFNLVDKGDFPELNVGKKSNDTDKSQTKGERIQDMYKDSKTKPATYQKKINEMFPTLGQDNSSPPAKYEQKKSSQDSYPQLKEEKKQKAWWQKINEKKKSNDEQQVQVVRIKKGGKNKKQKWASVKVEGLFGR